MILTSLSMYRCRPGRNDVPPPPTPEQRIAAFRHYAPPTFSNTMFRFGPDGKRVQPKREWSHA